MPDLIGHLFAIRFPVKPGMTKESGWEWGNLDIEEEMHNVAILNDIVLSLNAKFTGGTAGCL